MPRFYSMDLRTRVMDDIAAGLSLRKTAAKYSVSKQWIQILKKQLKETGSYAAKPLQGVAGHKRVLKAYQEQLKKSLQKLPMQPSNNSPSTSAPQWSIGNYGY